MNIYLAVSGIYWYINIIWYTSHVPSNYNDLPDPIPQAKTLSPELKMNDLRLCSALGTQKHNLRSIEQDCNSVAVGSLEESGPTCGCGQYLIWEFNRKRLLWLLYYRSGDDRWSSSKRCCNDRRSNPRRCCNDRRSNPRRCRKPRSCGSRRNIETPSLASSWERHLFLSQIFISYGRGSHFATNRHLLWRGLTFLAFTAPPKAKIAKIDETFIVRIEKGTKREDEKKND